MRKKRTKINCWTVTLFLPRSQLVQDNGPCCVTTCIVFSSLRKDWSRDPIVEEFGPGLLLDKELCCCWSWIVLSRTMLFLLTSLSHYFIFSVHKDIGLGLFLHNKAPLKVLSQILVQLAELFYIFFSPESVLLYFFGRGRFGSVVC